MVHQTIIVVVWEKKVVSLTISYCNLLPFNLKFLSYVPHSRTYIEATILTNVDLSKIIIIYISFWCWVIYHKYIGRAYFSYIYLYIIPNAYCMYIIYLYMYVCTCMQIITYYIGIIIVEASSQYDCWYCMQILIENNIITEQRYRLEEDQMCSVYFIIYSRRRSSVRTTMDILYIIHM